MAVSVSPLPSFDPEWASPKEWADLYRAVGLAPVPAHMPNAMKSWKRPSLETWVEWQTSPIPQHKHDEWFSHTGLAQMGAITFANNSQIFVVDLDPQTHGDYPLEWWRARVEVHFNGMDPQTPMQRTGGGGTQIFLRAPPGVTVPTFKTPVGIDIRGAGGFAMLPPSRHLSGSNYAWMEDAAPWEIAILTVDAAFVADIEQLHAQYGGGAGGGVSTPSPEAQYDENGLLIDGREDYMTRVVWARILDLYRANPNRAAYTSEALRVEMADAFAVYVSAVNTRLPGYEPKEIRLDQEGRGLQAFMKKWSDALAQWDTKVAKEAAVPNPKDEGPDNWGFGEITVCSPLTPSSSEDVPKKVDKVGFTREEAYFADPWEETHLPEFPLETLPLTMAEYTRALAISQGVDRSAVALACLGVAAGALDQSIRLKMKRTGTWLVPPRLSILLVGGPGTGKTPIIKECVRPLQELHSKAYVEYSKALQEWKSSEDKNEDDKPNQTWYLVNDSTTEKIAEILSHQDRGILLAQDEMNVWFNSMDSYGKSNAGRDVGFWTNSTTGGPYTVARVKGVSMVNNLCVSILGGVQPKIIKDLKSNIATDSGLIQRFLIVMMKNSTKSKDISDNASIDRWCFFIKKIAQITPATYLASPEAMSVFEDMEEKSLVLAGSDLDDTFREFSSKLRGVIGQLALILHLCDGGDHTPISGKAARNASIILEKFVIPHALHFYDHILGGGKEIGRIRSICSFVLEEDLMRFTARDFQRGPIRHASPAEIARAIAPLISMGWLIEEETRGAPPKAWRVAPGLRERLAQRRQEQKEARAKAAALLRPADS